MSFLISDFLKIYSPVSGSKEAVKNWVRNTMHDIFLKEGGVNEKLHYHDPSESKERAVQVTFLKNGTKSLPKLTSENLKNKWVEDGCHAGNFFTSTESTLTLF